MNIVARFFSLLLSPEFFVQHRKLNTFSLRTTVLRSAFTRLVNGHGMTYWPARPRPLARQLEKSSGKRIIHAMSIDLMPPELLALYEVHEWKHACAVLKTDFGEEFNDILSVLREFRLKRSAVQAAGGNISLVSREFDAAFFDRGWRLATQAV